MSDRYIYIRWTKHWDENGVVKLGKASNLKDRESTYRTGEYYPGEFRFVIDVGEGNATSIEHKLGECFTEMGYHEYNEGGGEEFYDKIILFLMLLKLLKNTSLIINLKYYQKMKLKKLVELKETVANLGKKFYIKNFRELSLKTKMN